MSIFVYSPLNKELRARLRSEASQYGEVIFNAEIEGRGADYIAQAEFILGNPPKDWLADLPRLRYWQLDSAGFNQYADVPAQGIICNMGDYFSIPCAETMMAGILAFYRLIPRLVQLQQEKKWIGAPLRAGMDVLSGKRVLILGAGTIAKAIGRMLRGFNCFVMYSGRTTRGHDVISFDQIHATAFEYDVVINTLPGNADQIVSRSFLDHLKYNVLYAAVGRGNTTDEAALLDALMSGKLLGAVLDVTMVEPLPSIHPFWNMENVLITQHTGGGQRNEDDGKVKLFLSNLQRFFNGASLENQVDLKRGY